MSWLQNLQRTSEACLGLPRISESLMDRIVLWSRGMEPQDLRNRLALFATDVEVFSRPLLLKLETRDVALQLRRSSTSTAANHRAAGRGRSHAEFTSKLGTALEEADETLYWLEHLSDCGLAPKPHLGKLIQESRELVAILTTSAQTARGRKGRR